ncbi:MAG: hypothetical protein LW817_08990 [Candidatus Caenarcaniphilales bacterium]|jgi:hypothetical protein|nr:hypothetical protein [Candidatus Caenarcaniphilales bacterium]
MGEVNNNALIVAAEIKKAPPAASVKSSEPVVSGEIVEQPTRKFNSVSVNPQALARLAPAVEQERAKMANEAWGTFGAKAA